MIEKKSGGVWETVKTIIYAVLIALFIRTLAYEPFNIPSRTPVPSAFEHASLAAKRLA